MRNFTRYSGDGDIWVDLLKVSAVFEETRECSDKGATIICLGSDEHSFKVKESVADVIVEVNENADSDFQHQLLEALNGIASAAGV
jgi:hypothetical protein